MKFTLLIGSLACSLTLYAQQPTVSAPSPDDSNWLEILLLANGTNPGAPLQETVPYMQSYDSLLCRWHERNIMNRYDEYFQDFIDIDSTATLTSDIPDSVYAARLKMILSPIDMPFNDVIKRYIIAYTTSRKGTLSNILGLSKYYFPMIEQELDRAGLPLELRMLPAIESALSTTARSRVGATGLWQFMYGTGKVYGLEITSFIDQRCDPVASTQAACRYLKDLYGMFGDWTLAIAAYNCGPGNVNKAIQRAGDQAEDFWDIYPFLPRETRGYLPSFIAATYAYTFHQAHGIEPVEVPLPLATDTVRIGRLMHFEQITSTIGTPVDLLRRLNPQYKLDIIPAVGKHYPLTLPLGDVSRFLANETAIQAKDTVYLAQYLRKTNDPKNPRVFNITSVTYKVKRGDTLGGIARKFGTTVANIKKWNRLRGDMIRIGQRLEIYR